MNMKKLTFVLICTLFATFVASAQLPEKAEDISPLLNG